VGSEAKYEIVSSGLGHILAGQLLEPGMAGLVIHREDIIYPA